MKLRPLAFAFALVLIACPSPPPTNVVALPAAPAASTSAEAVDAGVVDAREAGPPPPALECQNRAPRCADGSCSSAFGVCPDGECVAGWSRCFDICCGPGFGCAHGRPGDGTRPACLYVH